MKANCIAVGFKNLMLIWVENFAKRSFGILNIADVWD